MWTLAWNWRCCVTIVRIGCRRLALLAQLPPLTDKESTGKQCDEFAKREESLHPRVPPPAVAGRGGATTSRVGALENGEMSDGNLRDRLRRPGSLIAPGR
jgi:hypothetical protein